MKRLLPHLLCGLVLCGLALWGSLIFQAQNVQAQDDPTKDRTNVSLDQQRVQIRFKELQDKLLKLAEITEATDPNRAALLRKAFEQGSKQQIEQRLADLVKLIGNDQLGKAVDEQAIVKTELNKLLELLMSEQGPKRLADEKERIKKYLEAVKRLIKDETELEDGIRSGRNEGALANKQERVANETGKLGNDIAKNEGLKPNDGSKSGEGKSAEGKSGEGKSGEGKSGEGKSGEGKSGEGKSGKSGEGKSGEGKSGKSGEGKSGEGKSGEGKSGEGKSGEGKSGEGKSGKSGEGKAGEGKSGKSGEGKAGEGKSGKAGEGKAGEGKSGKSGEGKSGEGKSGEGKSGKSGEGKSGEGKSGKSKGGEGGQSDPRKEPPEGGEGGDSEGNPKPQDKLESTKKRIYEAEKRMRDAKQKLEKAQREGALKDAEAATKELKQIEKDLEDLLRQLREEEMERLLAFLEARFKKMLEMEIAVYEGTLRIDRTPQSQRAAPFLTQAARLGRDQSLIEIEAEKALNLLREDGTSVAMTESVTEMIGDMKQVVVYLSQGKTAALPTQQVEEDIIQALEEMIEALKKAQRDLKDPPKKQPPGQPGQPQDPSLIDMLAEVKMLRSLQLRVNRRTETYRRQLENPDDDIGTAKRTDLVKGLNDLKEREERIFRAARDLVTGRNK